MILSRCRTAGDPPQRGESDCQCYHCNGDRGMGSRGECRGFGSSCSTVVRFGWVCAQILLDYFNTVCAVRNKTTPQLCNRSECNRIITGHVVSGLDPPAKLSALGTMPACCRHQRVAAFAAQGGEPPLAGFRPISHDRALALPPARNPIVVACILSHVDCGRPGQPQPHNVLPYALC